MADAEIATTGMEQVRRSRNDIKPFMSLRGVALGRMGMLQLM